MASATKRQGRTAELQMAAEPKKESAKSRMKNLGFNFAPMHDDWIAPELVNGSLPIVDDIIARVAPSKLGTQLSKDRLALHKVMRRTDLKYAALIEQRKNGVLSRGWSVTPNPKDSDPKRAAEVAAFVEAALLDILDFEDDLKQLLDAIPVGYAVSEIEWVEREVNFAGTKRVGWVPDSLLQRRQGRFGFGSEGELRYFQTASTSIEVPAWKFVVHSHNCENEVRYGQGVAADVFWAYWMIHMASKWEMIFVEKFGHPIPTAKHPTNWTDEKKKALVKMMRAFRTEFAMVIPKDVEIELQEAQRYGSISAYQSVISRAHMYMSEYITGQSLATGQSQDGAGSFAQAKMHGESKSEFVDADGSALSRTLQTQLCWPIVALNFGPDVPCCLFAMNGPPEDLEAKLAMDERLVKMGVPLSVDYFYGTYGRPVPAEGQAVATVSSGGGLGFSGMPAQFAKGSKARDGRVESSGLQFAAAGKKVRENFALKAVAAGERIFADHSARVISMAKQLGSLEDLLQSVPAMRKELDADLRSHSLKSKFTAYLLAAAVVGKHHRAEMKASVQLAADDQVLQFASIDPLYGIEPLDPVEALAYFEGLVPMTREDLDSTLQEAGKAAFTDARMSTDREVERTQAMIAEYLREGKGVDAFVKDYQALYGGKRHEVELMYRDSVGRSYGFGRTKALLDPEVATAFPMWQYIAVGDNRTRPTHMALDGFCAPPDDPFWQRCNPPWEHGCRCDTIPVSQRQIDKRGLKHTGMVEVEGQGEQDPRTWSVSAWFRGLGF